MGTSLRPEDYTCHSGGCVGADVVWEEIGKQYGVKTIAYSFSGHVQYGEHPYIMNADELNEGWDNILVADKTLNRNVENGNASTYVRKLLCRNWFQIKHSERVLAIGWFADPDNPHIVEGGTGWAVQMAIDNKRDVMVFDQRLDKWLMFDYGKHQFIDFIEMDDWGIYRWDSPVLQFEFAGIGTRDMKENGIQAISDVYERHFGLHKRNI